MSILFGSGWGGGAPLLSLTPYAHRFCLQQKIGQLGSGRFCWWMFRCLYAGTCGQYMEGGPFGTSGEFYSSAELRDIEPDHTSEEDPSRLAWLQSYTGEAVVWLCRRPTCPSRYFQPPSLDERAFASEHRWEIPAARSRLDDIPTGDEFADEERQRSTEQGDATFWEEFDIPSELIEPEHDGVGPEFGSDPEPEEGGVGPPSLGDIESADDGAGYWESLAAIPMQQPDVAPQPIVPRAKAWRNYVSDGRTIGGGASSSAAYGSAAHFLGRPGHHYRQPPKRAGYWGEEKAKREWSRGAQHGRDEHGKRGGSRGNDKGKGKRHRGGGQR